MTCELSPIVDWEGMFAMLLARLHKSIGTDFFLRQKDLWHAQGH